MPKMSQDEPQLGEWLQEWRRKRGLTRPETVSEALKHDPRAAISPDYLAKLEYNDRSLAKASLAVREALRLALGIPREVWEEQTGLLTPAPVSTSPIPPVVTHRPLPVNIPRELQQVIDEYGDTYPQLRDETMQRILTAPRNFGGPDNGPQTSEEWLEWFLLSRRYLR